MTRSLVVAGAAVALLAGLDGAAQEANGPEFTVNSETRGAQASSSVAVGADGGFVVVWSSRPDSDRNIVARRFSPAGTPLGGDFQVNTSTTAREERPAVAALPGGGFVVVWEILDATNRSLGLAGRRFDGTGAPQGPEFVIENGPSSFPLFPHVAADATGVFVVAWRRETAGSSEISARRFDSAGQPAGPEFTVNTYTTGAHSSPRLAFGPGGDFLVVWTSGSQDGSNTGVFGQRFAADASPVGAEFRVNEATFGRQERPDVAVDASGRFVVVWQGRDYRGLAIFGREIDVTGAPLGGDFMVNTYTTGAQNYPSVARAATGEFLVTWDGPGPGEASLGIRGRRFDAAGAPAGDEFRVNSYTSNYQTMPRVAGSSAGDFVVTWQSFSQDGDSAGVFGQRYGDLVFADGFESGDLSGWSTAKTDGGDLAVTPAAALAGAYGLQALVDDTTSLYVQDDSPAPENRYRARFLLDPNGFDPGEANGNYRVRVFIAFNATAQRLVTIEMRRKAGVFALQGRVRRDDASTADTGFFTIADAPHAVEIDWTRASAPGASDGRFEMWIDGTSVSTLAALDNDADPVEYVRLGVTAVKTPLASGAVYFDDFASRRTRSPGGP